MMGIPTIAPVVDGGKSEDVVQQRVRLEAPSKGVLLFRNNVGVLKDITGRPVRYGLANDSKRMNESVKSADLIGLRRVLIEPKHVGLVIGQFVSRECKHEGWTYGGTEHEVAQLKWVTTIQAYGGDACFVTGEGSL